MQLYKTTYSLNGLTKTTWTSSEADASKVRSAARTMTPEEGPKPDPKTTPENITPNKQGIVAFLNTHCGC
jgi:hypothetical protein